MARIAFIGDVMLGRLVTEQLRRGLKPERCWGDVAPLLRAALQTAAPALSSEMIGFSSPGCAGARSGPSRASSWPISAASAGQSVCFGGA